MNNNRFGEGLTRSLVLGCALALIAAAAACTNKKHGPTPPADGGGGGQAGVVAAPTLSSPTVSPDVDTTTAILGATVDTDGGDPAGITERGTAWNSTGGAPIVDNPVAEGGTTLGAFSHPRNTLPIGTLIFYNGYAVNSAGTAYSPTGAFYTEPTQASGTTFPSVDDTTMTISWTPGTGGPEVGTLVVLSTSNALGARPIDGTTYRANPAFQIGDALGNGFVVYSGEASRVDVTSLTENTLYHAFIFAFAGTGAPINYQQDAPETGRQSTMGGVAPLMGRAILGPIAGGNADLYLLSDLEAGTFLSATTATSNVLAEAGRIDVPPERFVDEELYLVVVSGGQDVDADDDGVLDAIPTPINGEVHAILTGAQIKAGDWRVTILTEAAYQSVVYLIRADYDQQTILEALDQAAERLVARDITGDSVVDSSDLNRWDPIVHGAQALLDDAAKRDLLANIHAGVDTADTVAENTSPVLGYTDSLGLIYDIEIGGDLTHGVLAYVATQSRGLEIVNLSDPLNPEPLADLPFSGVNSRHVAKGGITALIDSTACIPQLTSCLWVIGVEQTLSPHRDTTIPEIRTRDIAGDGDFFYVLTDDSLLVIDVSYRTNSDSDTTEPEIVDEVQFPSWRSGFNAKIQLVGDRIYATGQSALAVLDRSTPDNPVLLREISLFPARGLGIVAGHHHFSPTGREPERTRLVVRDISNLNDVFEVAEIPLPLRSEGVVEHSDDVAYIGTGLDVIAVDISTPEAPVIIGRVPLGERSTGALTIFRDRRPLGVVGAVEDINEGRGRLDVINLADPAIKGVAGTINLQDRVKATHVSESTAYLAADRAGLEIVDLTDPTAPTRLGGMRLPGNQFSMSVVVQGDHAFVGANDGLHVANVSDPTAPQSVLSDANFSTVKQLVPGRTGFMYLVNPDGLQQVDIRQAGTPTAGPVLETVTGDFVLDVVTGTTTDTAYVFGSLGSGTLGVYSFTDTQSAATLEGHFDVSPSFAIGGVAVADGTAWIATEDFGGPGFLLALDVSDPTSISEISAVEIPRNGRVLVADGTAVVSNELFGLDIFDVSDAAAMRQIGSVLTLGGGASVVLSNGFAVVGNLYGLETVRLPVREVP